MLAFIDESGTPHPKDACETWSLAAVCIPRASSRLLAAKLWGLKAHFYGRPKMPGVPLIELKAHRMFSRQAFTRASKGNHRAQNHLAFVEAVFNVIGSFPNLSVFGITGTRPTREPQVPDGLLPWHYVFLLQRIHYLAKAAGPGCIALAVFDQKDPQIDENLARAFTHHLFNTWEGRSWANIIETGMFVSSRNTPGVQLADLIASCLRFDHEFRLRGLYGTADKFAALVKRYTAVVRSRTVDFPLVGGRLFGIYVMPERYFFPPPRPSSVVVVDPEEVDEA